MGNLRYYVTIRTQNRYHYFGKIVNGEMQLSKAGATVENIWLDIPNHFSFVILDQYMIMPNHIHGILIFNKNDDDCRGDGKDAINRVFTVDLHFTFWHVFVTICPQKHANTYDYVFNQIS